MNFQHKKRPYSFIYKIYRRIRFIRYKKNLIKNEKLAIKIKEEQEQHERLIQIREFRISEKQQQQLKLKAEREETRRLKKELKAEFRERDKLARKEYVILSAEDKRKNRLALQKEKKARKRRSRLSFRIRKKKFLRSLRSLNISTIKRKWKSFRDNAPKRRRLFLISFNSTVLFLLSYFALFLLSQAITVITARFYDYPTTVYYYEIYFNISQESWFHDSVKTIFSAGPIINFVIGITFLIIYSKVRETNGPFKLFFLWGFLHAVNMLFGALLVGTLFDKGVGYVISWMYIMDSGKVFYSILSIFMLVIAGLISTRQFLISGNTYYNEINPGNRSSFIFSQVFLPFLAGNAFLLIIRQPRFVFYDTFIALTLIICILPIMFTYTTYNELYFEEDEKKPGIIWIAVGVLILAVSIFRVLLEFGLRFSG